MIQASLPTLIAAIFFGSHNALALPLLDEAPLHLRHHAQDRQDDMPYLPSRRDMGASTVT